MVQLRRFEEHGGGGGGGYRPRPTKVVDTYQPTTNQKPQTTNSPTTKTVKVTDEFGTPLPGAHVYFTQNNGTTTDFNGNASLSSNSGAIQTHISYMGFKTQTYPFNALPATVKLQPAANALNEVVVTAPSGKKEVPKYLFPALGAAALLLIVMSIGSPPAQPPNPQRGNKKPPRSKPKPVTL